MMAQIHPPSGAYSGAYSVKLNNIREPAKAQNLSCLIKLRLMNIIILGKNIKIDTKDSKYD